VKNGDGGLIGIPASSAEKSINWPARYNHCMEELENDLNRAPLAALREEARVDSRMGVVLRLIVVGGKHENKYAN
jgi:hypothetical protein